MSRVLYSQAGRRGALAAVVLAFANMVGCSPVEVQYKPPEAPPPPAVYVAPAPAVVVEPPAPPAENAPDSQLQPLVAPIALYPDPLLADVLPAASYPDQITAAEAFVEQNPNPTDDAIAAQNWDPSVQGLVHYPTVLAQLAGDMDWTKSLGSAFNTEQADVMGTIQDLRAQAVTQGNLVSTPEQTVVTQPDGHIAILPATEGSVYVPAYDPAVVYTGRYAVTFGPAYVVGPWLRWGFDWGGAAFYVGPWRGGFVLGPGGWGWTAGWVRPVAWGFWAFDVRWGPRPFWAPGRWVFARGLRGRPWHAVRGRFRAAAHSRAARESRGHAAHGAHGAGGHAGGHGGGHKAGGHASGGGGGQKKKEGGNGGKSMDGPHEGPGGGRSDDGSNVSK